MDTTESPDISESTVDRSKKLSLGIIILNWNHPEDTLRCLESLSRSSFQNYYIVIVDNGSDDRSLNELRDILSKFDRRGYFANKLTLLESPQNLGYTGGNNLGIKYYMTQTMASSELPPDYLLLLNDDATVDENTLGELVQTAEEHPEAGFLGPKIMALEEPEVLLSAGGILADGYQPLNRGMGEVDHGQFDHSVEMDFISGCALMVKRQVVEQIGMLDDDYFAYHEEIDWCYRGSQAGFVSRIVPSARVWHPDTRRRDQNSPSVTYYIVRNRLLFARKHKLGQRVINRMLVEDLRMLISWSLKPKWQAKKSQRNALASALIDDHFQVHGRWKKPA